MIACSQVAMALLPPPAPATAIGAQSAAATRPIAKLLRFMPPA
jgi:hypothetical protein